MPYVYKIINSINNKIYIGQTVNKIEYRLQEHWHASVKNKDKSVLHVAMRKYGKETFNIELIEEVDIINLSDRERYWIDYYKATDRNIGYNITVGGEGTRTIDRNKVLELWNTGLNRLQIAEALGICRQSVSVVLKAYNITGTHKQEKKL